MFHGITVGSVEPLKNEVLGGRVADVGESPSVTQSRPVML